MRDGGSFRDPSGFIFYEDGNVYRSIYFSYKENFNHLVNSGLYDDLVQKGLLIKHNEVDVAENNPHQYKKLLVVNFYRFIIRSQYAFIDIPIKTIPDFAWELVIATTEFT